MRYLPNDTNIYIHDKNNNDNISNSSIPLTTKYSFAVNDIIDCRDKWGKWYLSTIKKHKKTSVSIPENELNNLGNIEPTNVETLKKLEGVYVHYNGWDDKFDEWIVIHNDILCQCHRKCVNKNHIIAKANKQSVTKIDTIAKRNVDNYDQTGIVKLTMAGLEPMRIKVKMTTKWKKIFQAFAKDKGLHLEETKFLFKKSRIEYVQQEKVEDCMSQFGDYIGMKLKYL